MCDITDNSSPANPLHCCVGSCHSSSSSNTNSIEITTISSDDGGTEGGTEGGADAECRAGTVAGSGYGGGRNEQLVLCRRKKWTPDLLSKPISVRTQATSIRAR